MYNIKMLTCKLQKQHVDTAAIWFYNPNGHEGSLILDLIAYVHLNVVCNRQT